MRKNSFAAAVLTACVLGTAAASGAAPQQIGSASWNDTGVIHEYRVYSDPGKDWDSANNWILSTLGNSWHLATITSAAEQAFFETSILPLASGELWLGGFQEPLTTTDPAANWTWITGEPWSYTNWSSGEPNDARCCGGWMEQHLAFGGGWNDEGFLPNLYGFVAERETPQSCVQPPSGMIGWWPGDGNVNDIIGGHPGSLINGAAFASGMVGEAISFDGVDDRIEVCPGADLDITGPLSIDAWFKLAAPPSSMSSPVVAKWGDSLYGGAGYGLFILGPGYLPGPAGKAALLVSSTGGDIYIVASPAPISLNEWHHLAGTYDGASLKLYVDGVMVAERAYSSGIHVNSAPLVMGSYNPRYTSFTGPMRGFIDEVELFNRALSANEIRAIHHAGSAGKCKNRPPIAAAGADQTIETTSCAGAGVTLDGSGSSDPDGDALTYAWAWSGGSASGAAPTVTLPYGATTVTLTVDDGKGGTSTDEVIINVVDTTPPVLNATLSPNLLWPPNHKYVTVAPSVTVQDACAESVVVELLSSTCNEPDNGLGDGDTANDIVVNADGTLSLRAERSGTGSGRVYTVSFQATDQAGNSATASTTVDVPHDMSNRN